MQIESSGLQNNIEPALRVLAMPKDANPSGDIFGGWIMAQVDIAGAVVATDRAHGKVVTIAVTDFLFKQPVFVGDLVSCYAKIIKTGTTSMTVFVEVFARRDNGLCECIKVTEATVVYVAVDKNRQPVAIPEEKSTTDNS